MSYEDEAKEEASDRDWMHAAESVREDLDNFDAFLWPIYRDHGVSKETATVCFYLHLIAVGGKS